jgi:UDP-3-O-[3-hydroxymyristoyl] glucosamine N-acyltransferase
MAHSLQEIADFVRARVVGDANLAITGIASLGAATSGDLVFVEDEKHFPAALASRASAVIVGSIAGGHQSTKPLLISDQPRLAFARAAELLLTKSAPDAGIHSTALVHPTARLGSNVAIAESVVVGEMVEIGKGTTIAAGCVIGPNVSIGRDCHIYPNVTIYPSTRLGDRVILHAGVVLGSDGFGYVRDKATGKYHKFPQVGRLEIEDDVEIGSNSTVDRGALEATRIARGTKIDNLVHVGHNVQIGEDVVIAAQTGLSGSAVVENAVIIGGQVGIADHVRIESGAILGAQSGIPSKKVIRGKGVVFWGTPARPIRDYLKELAVLARLSKKK